MEEKRITENETVAFEAWLRGQEKAAATIRKYVREAAAFLAFLGGEEISRAGVLAYKAALSARYSPAGVNGKLAAVNAYLRFCGLPDCRAQALKIQRAAYCPPERELTKAEYLRLLGAAEKKKDDRLHLLLQTVCGTGIRISELPFITVEAAKSGAATVRCKGKSRAVFLIRGLRKKLLQYAGRRGIKSGPIFITRTGRPVDRTNVWREMKTLCAAAKVDTRKVFPHNLRHLFARTFYALEKDIVKLADILGHSSVNTTRIYTVSTGAEHLRKMERMQLVC